MKRFHLLPLVCLVCPVSLAFACREDTPEPAPEERPAIERNPEPTATAAPKPTAPTPPPALNPAPASDDPVAGKFTLEDATKDLAGKGSLVAEIKTDLGKLECKLYDDRAPITVANFVGLARGLRPFKNPDREWVKKPAYDGTTFHRVIKGFMVQGGDPAGTGGGEPGYVIKDELWPGATHDRRGLLCMANRGPNTNGMQFFITDAAAPHLDRSYTIFGECGPDAVIEKLVSVEVRGDKSVTPTKIEKVTIKRGATAARAAGSAKNPTAPKPATSAKPAQ
jgi:peptidyl-prolyl cis-trans isomerase A (cyclophilin A)